MKYPTIVALLALAVCCLFCASPAWATSSFDDSTDSHKGCTLCQFGVVTIQTYLQQNYTWNDARKQLLAVCKLFPQSLEAPCYQFVEYYTYPIYWVLETKTDAAEDICTKRFTFCPTCKQ